MVLRPERPRRLGAAWRRWRMVAHSAGNLGEPVSLDSATAKRSATATRGCSMRSGPPNHPMASCCIEALLINVDAECPGRLTMQRPFTMLVATARADCTRGTSTPVRCPRVRSWAASTSASDSTAWPFTPLVFDEYIAVANDLLPMMHGTYWGPGVLVC